MRVLFFVLAAAPLAALAASPTAESLLKTYDGIMGAENFDSVMEMTSHRDDDSERTYKMRLLKFGEDKMRIWFDEPAAVRGQEILRQGENMWVYMPNMKRSVRIASRESFQGGDFNNADVLRVNYTKDYDAKLVEPSTVPNTYMLELKAKTADASYDLVKLWLRTADSMPVKGEYYTQNGTMLRAAEFSEVKSFAGFKRPTKIVMKNMLATQRFSTMVVRQFNVKVKPTGTQFVLDNLGR